jgi:hypothetical protein
MVSIVLAAAARFESDQWENWSPRPLASLMTSAGRGRELDEKVLRGTQVAA